MPFLGGRGQSSRGYFGGGTTPDAPTSLVATRGNTEISVAFSAPAFNGGLDITNYEYSLNAGTTWTAFSPADTTSPVLITGLINGTSYTVYLRAVNALGSGKTSEPANAATPSTTPGAPTNVNGTPNGVTQSTVSWTAPANNGGSDINGYRVEYAISPYSSYTVFNANTGNANTSILVTGLVNGGSYKFRVTARNIVNGFGLTSAESAVVVTNVVPAAPTIGTMTLSTTSTVDSLAWTAPTPNGGSAITEYVYQTTTNDGSTFSGPTPTGSTAVSRNFDPGYTTVITKVRVAAKNSLGTGPYSATSTTGYGGWSNPSYVITDDTDCPNCGSCPCPSCAGGCDSCGTRSITGSNTITGTKGYKSKTCYKWTRGAQENAGPFNAGTTDACTAAYGDCSAGTCGCTAGDPACGCSACSDSWQAFGNFFDCVLATGTGGAPDGYYYLSVYGWIWSGSFSDCSLSASCGEFAVIGANDVTKCNTTGQYRANTYVCIPVF